jgi:hypothetical protein
MFSTPANLGIVAYGKVHADGSTPDLNSGVTIDHTPNTGLYIIHLPGDPTLQEPLQEGQSNSPQRDLLFITPCDSSLVFFFETTLSPPSDFKRAVQFVNDANPHAAVDVNFSFLLVRSLISPPVDDSGVQAPA